MAVVGDDAAENRVERVHQCGGVPNRGRVHFRFDEQEPREIPKELVEIHERLLKLTLVR